MEEMKNILKTFVRYIIGDDVFCWRVLSEPPNFFQEGLYFAV